ncbi:class I SAM-dependent methyltransferase [Pseudarthrobacter phenanthrenivorans]|uniref:Class I SAM-dependent methyltransferase n=1 Tax=Pseudarthrobacter phenanthrenivorans TaxID=361575 RepID=A0A3B0FXN7_PSEPS|nr:class I SAM-dependent methyltransferase [Pseudarthrobacter phenanthrenivorans]RKO24448.1 class I SAM-dependent methyltransferase [Pseudarthrobacter phenanthrenivorans]
MVQKAERVAAPQLSGRNRAGRQGKPVGNVTRGTTNPNRMRRVDRWLAGPQGWRLRKAVDPLIVDLGYGASPATAVELHDRLSAVRPDVQVYGIEIEPGRVRAALPLERPGLSFRVGGFELPVPGQPVLVRAFNVLRQYEEADVAGIWRLVQDRLAPGGLFVDGTCDEIGRRVAWIALDAERPVSLSISVRFGSFELPSDVAERLPKALIHRNVPGEPVHALMQAMDRAWLECAPLAAFGNRQRWQGMCSSLRDAGWPVQDGPSRWRLGELTVDWDSVAPNAG